MLYAAVCARLCAADGGRLLDHRPAAGASDASARAARAVRVARTLAAYEHKFGIKPPVQWSDGYSPDRGSAALERPLAASQKQPESGAALRPAGDGGWTERVLAPQRMRDLEAQCPRSAPNMAARALAAVPGSTVMIVTTQTGKTVTLHVNFTESVAVLKERIFLSEGITAFSQRLVFGGKDLKDDCTLADYDIQKESKVHLLLRLTGC